MQNRGEWGVMSHPSVGACRNHKTYSMINFLGLIDTCGYGQHVLYVHFFRLPFGFAIEWIYWKETNLQFQKVVGCYGPPGGVLWATTKNLRKCCDNANIVTQWSNIRLHLKGRRLWISISIKWQSSRYWYRPIGLFRWTVALQKP